MGTHQSSIASAAEQGLILVADPSWLEYHAYNSQGSEAIFYRGTGARVAALAKGGTVFCVQNKETPRMIHAWGTFQENVIRHYDQAWFRFGAQLGAATKEEWKKQAAGVLARSERKDGEICAIRLSDFQSLAFSVDPRDAGIEVSPSMVKGHSLTHEEVAALWGIISSTPTVNEPLPIERLEKELEAAVRSSAQTGVVARRNRLKRSPRFPAKVRVLAVDYRRNPDVVAEVLNRANGFCEQCGEKAPFLRAKDGTPYLEVHHWQTLADGGEDTVENAGALCPNCHREVHFGEEPSRKDQVRHEG